MKRTSTLAFQRRVACLYGSFGIAVLLCSCSSPQRSTHQPVVSPRSLVDMADVAWDFEWRQTIEANYPNPKQRGLRETASLEAVLQKQGSVLTMVGLTPMGTRAFVARQAGVTVTSEGNGSQALPIPAALVFLDINRSLFVGIGQEVLPDGWHAQQSHGANIKDLWKGGLLVQRQLHDPAANTTLSIHYSPGYKAGVAPTTLTLSNLRFDYRLTITTLEAS